MVRTHVKVISGRTSVKEVWVRTFKVKTAPCVAFFRSPADGTAHSLTERVNTPSGAPWSPVALSLN